MPKIFALKQCEDWGTNLKNKILRFAKQPFTLWWYFTLSTFIISILTGMIMGFVFIVLSIKFGFTDHMRGAGPLGMSVTTSAVLSTFITTYIGRRFLEPIDRMSKATQTVAKGDFNMALSTDKLLHPLKNMYQNFNTMVKELASIETLRSDFVNNVSHEFKTPLAVIEGYAMLLQSKDLSDEERNYYLDMIIQSTHQLTNLTTNILMISKLENQGEFALKSSYALDEQLRQALLLLENSWSEKDLELDLDIEENVQYYGQADLMMQVWLNIIGNAIKYSYNSGYLSVSLNKENNRIHVAVQDTGIGMDEDTKKRIFDKFYQGDNSRSSDGAGLGLPLVKEILDLNQGEIEVTSARNEGTTVNIYLPL